MGQVHQLILREGLESARSKAESRADRQAVEAAGFVLTEEVSRLGITHAGFAMTSRPAAQAHRGAALAPSGTPHDVAGGVRTERGRAAG